MHCFRRWRSGEEFHWTWSGVSFARHGRCLMPVRGIAGIHALFLPVRRRGEGCTDLCLGLFVSRFLDYLFSFRYGVLWLVFVEWRRRWRHFCFVLFRGFCLSLFCFICLRSRCFFFSRYLKAVTALALAAFSPPASSIPSFLPSFLPCLLASFPLVWCLSPPIPNA